jgi:hypothetical protein
MEIRFADLVFYLSRDNSDKCCFSADAVVASAADENSGGKSGAGAGDGVFLHSFYQPPFLYLAEEVSHSIE